jgi:DeoR/GlpR family transcriptional regulator of sugar metabolism
MMWVQERHHRILALLRARQRVASDAIAAEFNVSRETVRRDLLDLETAGQLQRVHGGAVITGPFAEEPFAARQRVRRREKRAIARAAAALVKPGQACFVDAGTTTLAFAEELSKLPGITVFTNSLDIARLFGDRRDGEVLLLGGCITSDVPATYGELTLSEIGRFGAEIAIFSPVAINPERGAMSYAFHEAEVARAMIRRADRAVLLADRDKLGTCSRVEICTAGEIDTLVTDIGAEPTLLDRFAASGVREIIRAPVAPRKRD